MELDQKDKRVTAEGASDLLVEEIGSWPEVRVSDHERGGFPVFHVGRRQLGHLHVVAGGPCFADMPLPRRLRDDLIAAGRARPHSAMPDSGWLTVPIETAADLRGALELFRSSYERAIRKAEARSRAAV